MRVGFFYLIRSSRISSLSARIFSTPLPLRKVPARLQVRLGPQSRYRAAHQDGCCQPGPGAPGRLLPHLPPADGDLAGDAAAMGSCPRPTGPAARAAASGRPRTRAHGGAAASLGAARHDGTPVIAAHSNSAVEVARGWPILIWFCSAGTLWSDSPPRRPRRWARGRRPCLKRCASERPRR